MDGLGGVILSEINEREKHDTAFTYMWNNKWMKNKTVSSYIVNKWLPVEDRKQNRGLRDANHYA